MTRIGWWMVLCVVVMLVGCGDSNGEASGSNDPDDNHNQEPVQGPTYYEDIEPLMQTHCTGCHVPDDIAPFPMQTYEEVKAISGASLLAMQVGTMPPWPPDDDCGDFKDSRGMSAEEIELFEEWIEAGHPEGDPDAGEGGESSTSFQIDGQPDVTLDWGFDYEPQPPGEGGVDDYRCFVIDPEIDEDQFVSMVHTRPDNAEIVHHMIAYVAPGDEVDELEALEAEDERPGYECFGGPRVSDATWLAAWAPGEIPAPFEEGAGIRLQDDAKIVVQMHYNMVNDPDGVDRTEVDVYFVDEEEHPDPTELLMVPFPVSDLHIPAGDPEAMVSGEGPEIPFDLTIHGVFPHMHLLGTEIRVSADTAEGETCLIDIPRWDFDWQGFYMYEEPVELAPPSTVEMTCVYDNSADNQPDGRTPEDVSWGDGTYDEMCLAVFVVEVPPGFEDLL